MSLIKFQRKIGATPDGKFGPNTLKLAVKYFGFSKDRGAHFFGQLSHETAGFTIFIENLNYSSQSLANTWPARYSVDSKKRPLIPNALANSLARKPQDIANNVYANRMGNGDSASNDGWNFRGRGAIQLTGRTNYQNFSNYIKQPNIMTCPDLVADEYIFESALFFFENNKLWSICDQGVNTNTITSLTKRINGGTNGLQDRIKKTNSYYESIK
jgi:putative chitinase